MRIETIDYLRHYHQMLESFLRPYYQKTLVNSYTLSILRIFGVSPNFLTLLACLVGISVAPLLAYGHTWLACFALLLSGYLDIMDGTLARLGNRSTEAGTVFDIMSDRVVECAVMLGLYAINPGQRGWYVLIMFSVCLLCVTSFLVVGIFSNQRTIKQFYYSPGLIERAEAFIFFIAMILIPSWFGILAVVFTILAFYTTIKRVWQFTRYSL